VARLHEVLAWVAIVLNGVTGAWVLAANWMENLRSKTMWFGVHTAHAVVAVQVTVGALLVAGSDLEVDGTHMFYGFLTLLAVGLIVGYRQLAQYRYLLYGLGGLFIMGLSIRAMTLNAIAG
jgi:hypothetical protein